MYDDIRPYRESEVPQVIQNLVADQEFQTSIALYVMPKLARWFPAPSRYLVERSLKKRVRHIHSINDMQTEIGKYMDRMIKTSTNGFSHEGMDQLDLSKPTLFISNHRDIAMDPALVNYAMHHSGHQTVEIAIGDNLLSKPWISDLMRINRSFIVKRSEKTKRAMLTASKQLSGYIHHTLNDNHTHVWIAQKEGRAKDGKDQTNSALISMLLLNKPKPQSISEYLSQLNIVPVTIAYEFDPCDQDKAKELAQLETHGNYEKDEHEDIRSITQGIVGHKGRIHMKFGQPILGDYEDSKAIAAEIDRQIIGNYKLYDSNLSAHAKLTNNGEVIAPLAKRLEGLSEVEQRLLLTMYANPVFAKESL